MLLNLASLTDILHDPVWMGWTGTLSALLIGILGIVVPLLPPRKLVTFQYASDVPLPPALQIQCGNQPVPTPSLAVIKVRNQGWQPIVETDHKPPLTFIFPGRKVLSAAVIASEPQWFYAPDPARPGTALSFIQAHTAAPPRAGSVPIPPGAGSITLPQIDLNVKDSITIGTFLAGAGGEMKLVEGRILKGKVKSYGPKFSKKKLVIIICSAFASAAILTATFLPRSIVVPPPDCGSGLLNIGGSTALYPLVNQLAQQYHNRCPNVLFTVNQNANTSEAGLLGVENGSLQIGDSDIFASPDEADLVDQPVAVVAYVVVVNADVALAVANLTTEQLRDIYSGKTTNWMSSPRITRR